MNIQINGKTYYLWHVVDQDGDALIILMQSRRNKAAALKFFRKLLKKQGASASGHSNGQAKELLASVDWHQARPA